MTPITLSAELVTEGPVSRYEVLNCRPYRPSAAQAHPQARRGGAVDREGAQKEPAQIRVLRSLGAYRLVLEFVGLVGLLGLLFVWGWRS